MSSLRLAWRNIFRNKRRTLLTLTAIMAGVMALVLFDGFVRYTLWGLQEATIRNGLGHLQLATAEDYFTTGNFDPFRYLITGQEAIVRKLQALPEVKSVVPQVTFAATLASAEKSGIVTVQAVPAEYSRSLLSFRQIVAGRDLQPEDRYRVVLARGVAEKTGAKVGDTMTIMTITRNGGLNAADLEVVGIATLGLRELDNLQVYLDLATAMEFLDITSVPLLITVLEKTAYTGQVKAVIAQMFNPASGRPLVVKDWEELADYYRQVRGFYGALLQIIRLIIMLVVIFTIINTLTMSVLERTREIGTLRALGTRRTGIIRLFLTEGLWIGLLGGSGGVALGLAVSSVINNLFGGIYIPPPPGMAEGYQAFFTPSFATVGQNFLLAAAVSVLASVYPVYKRGKDEDCRFVAVFVNGKGERRMGRMSWRVFRPRVSGRFSLVFIILVMYCFLTALPVDASLETAEAVLRRVDENRVLKPQFAFEMVITAYQSGEVIDRYTLAGYVRIAEGKAQTLLYFLDPPKVNGRKMLMSGDEIWMHFPKTKNVIKLTPIQILLGEAANGDILQMGFAADYQCRFRSEGESPENWCLLLEARANGGGIYPVIVLWVNKETSLPVAGEFYARSGKLLKSVVYQEYRTVLGKPVAMKVTIRDGTQPDRYTVMEYTRLVEKSLPPHYYRKEYLPRFAYVPLD